MTTRQVTTLRGPDVIGSGQLPTRAQRAAETSALTTALAQAVEPDEIEQLRKRIILINRGVAEAVAARYESRGVCGDDLRQVAYEGLTKAAHRFDPALRNDFLTFAVPTIRGELQRHFRDRGWVVRPPRRVQEARWRITQVRAHLDRDLGRAATAEEVAQAAGVSLQEYRDAAGANGCFRPTSLDALVSGVGGGTMSVGDLQTDDEPDRQYEIAEAWATLTPMIRRLSERDRRIIFLRFFEDMTQEEIGADIGVTQMQVSRLLARILEQLRVELRTAPGH